MSCPLYIQGLAGELVNVLREAGQTVPTALTNFGTHVKKKVSRKHTFFMYFTYNYPFTVYEVILLFFVSSMYAK